MFERTMTLWVVLSLAACGGGSAASCPDTATTSGSETPSANHAAAPQSIADASGNWTTLWGDVPDQGGGGNSDMQLVNRQEGVIFSYGDGNVMTCAMNGASCVGSWVGGSGSGWFDVTFDVEGSTFTGTWGYGPVRAASGTFAGQRTPM